MSLNELLPHNYDYKFVECEFSSITDFKCVVRADINSNERFVTWLKDFESRTNTTWILRKSKVNGGVKGFEFSRDYICHHSSHRKRTAEGKNKKCGATLTIRIKKNTKFIRCRDVYVREGLCAILKIDFNHSHRTDVAEAWNWLRRSDETKSIFQSYFNQGFSPSAAKVYHESLIISDNPEQLANSQRNPPLKWIYQSHEKWLKKNFSGLKVGADFEKTKMPDEGIGNISHENTVPANINSSSFENVPSTSKSTTLSSEPNASLLNRQIIAEKFSTVMKKLVTIIEKEESVDVEIVEKFIQKAKNVKSGSDLNNLLNPF